MEYSKLKSLLRQMILVPMALTATLAILLLWETFDLNRSIQSVDHTDRVLDQSGHLLALLVNMESGMRGFIVTGDESFLQPYTDGTRRLESEYQALYRMVAENLPRQQQRLQEIHAGYLEWNEYASQIIAQRRAGKADPTFYENKQGKLRMDSLRGQILEFQSVEAGLRIERVQAAHTRWVVMVTSFLGLGLGVGIFLALFTRYHVKKMGNKLLQSEERWTATLIVLWLLILRGISIELRNHVEAGVWRALLDGVFGLASALLAIFFGAALANVLRGVPLNADGYFFLPLWTNWQPGIHPGILDWYSIIGGLVALVALMLHGALWLIIKTSGDLAQRARRIVTPLWIALAALTAVSLAATIIVRPASLNNYFSYPFTFVVPAGVIASMAGVWLLNRSAQPIKAFLSSCLYLFFMLSGACWGLYPTLLPATTGADRDITLGRAISGPHTLAVGLVWWGFGMVQAIGYIVFVYAKFRGKVDLHAGAH